MKLDLISKIAIILMILSIVVTLGFLYQRNVVVCTSDPLTFSAKLYETNYQVKATGSLTLWPEDNTKKVTTILFNSTGFEVKN